MINSNNNLSGKLAVDVKDMDQLRQAARQNSPEALRETAKQFEALFMNLVMKSMRQATPQDGVFDSEQSRMYTSMLDQQLSQNMAKRGVGLADVLIRQLSSTVGAEMPAELKTGVSASDPFDALPPRASGNVGDAVDDRLHKAFNAMASAMQNGVNGKSGETYGHASAQAAEQLDGVPGRAEAAAANKAGEVGRSARGGSRAPHVQAFQERLAAHADEASRATGIPAKFMLGQAALESGWGRREIKGADGTPSHNLFGIKATAGWKGKVVETMTTEYVNGVVQRKVEKFRAYDSYADAFRDYARLLSKNPRYQNVMANAQDAVGFARGLQKAGYATDPHYADKLARIITKTLSA
jgi:peptidoglycan hydrolase FlgJ